MTKKKIEEELVNEEEIIIDYNDEINKNSLFRKILFIFILIIILTIIYARYIGTSGLFIKEYSIINNKLPKSFNGLKIAHFSDFHYGKTTSINTLKKVVKEINLMKPDIIIFTGDLIDKDIKIENEDMNNIISELSKLNSTYGNYYISGEHDIKFDKFDEIMTNSNFISLNDKYDIIYNKNNESILINGIDYKGDINKVDDLFKNELPNYKINIMHLPDTYLNLKDYNFDLVLAGHSHNGQVSIPFYGALFTDSGAKKYYKPYYKINNSDFYISSGIGTSNYNYRLFNRPSFSLYRIKNSA